ncbi:class I histocompatibility antigen, Gogo-B*0201 alpha chain-like isoform X2 [Rhineura floridana]|uniref:class I histocompatibility antigen, Gogo-B*0201 alpha chain-like isoform X2 n=1 Tax=Rhineura floridana TaxID=261503 RepID=UPI002AC87CA0|nr:class I histocompatibility antigen, Gogo-B*0201 alpha chain-like isoform X2 [Rhineura floridana]
MRFLLRGCLLLLGGAAILQGGCSGSTSHSLHYFHLAILEPGQERPHFIAVGYMDNQLFASYSSDTKRYQPRAPWIERALSTEYWDGQSKIGRGNEQLYRVDLVTLGNRYNQSEGLHTLQYMAGCELSPDGRKGGYSQFGYDGRDFLSLDKETLTWTAADAEAQMTKRKLDADVTLTQGRKYYLEEVCIEWLQKFLALGQETLLRTVNAWLIIGAVLGAVAPVLLMAAGIIFFIIRKERANAAYRAASLHTACRHLLVNEKREEGDSLKA